MGWIIAAAIVLFFALIFAGKVAVYFDYNGTIAVTIKYMCFTILHIPKQRKKPIKAKKSKKQKKSEKADNSEEITPADVPSEQAPPAPTEEVSEKSAKTEKSKKAKKSDKDDKSEKGEKKKFFDITTLTFDDIIALVKLAFASVRKPLRKLFKSITFSHLSIRATVGGDDAAKTAIKFGALNMAAGNVLGLIDSYFTLKPLDDMNIGVDFQSEQSVYDVYFEVRMTVFAALAAGFKLIFAGLKLITAYKKKSGANIKLRKASEKNA